MTILKSGSANYRTLSEEPVVIYISDDDSDESSDEDLDSRSDSAQPEVDDVSLNNYSVHIALIEAASCTDTDEALGATGKIASDDTDADSIATGFDTPNDVSDVVGIAESFNPDTASPVTNGSVIFASGDIADSSDTTVLGESSDYATRSFINSVQAGNHAGDAAIESLAPTSFANCQVAQELATIRASLARIEAEFFYSTIPGSSPMPSSETKRKACEPSQAVSKRQRKSYEVNIRATRAWLPVDDEPKCREYVMKRKRGEERQCWKSAIDGQQEEVDGEYLLCFAADLSIEIRANADWLPLSVRWNHEAGVFEGTEGIDGKTLQIGDATMLDLMRGGVDSHKGLII